MQPEGPLPTAHDTALHFPPVTPPSGRMLVQLFMVPALIVAALVVLVLVLWWLFGGRYEPQSLLQRLDDPNGDVRWRAAEDLAAQLPGDDHLASDPKFALDIADRLRLALDADAAAEKAAAGQTRRQQGTGPDQQTRDTGRTVILYLSASLGNFMVPVGLPLLEDLATQDKGGDQKSLALRRRQAVWALANLGQSLTRWDKLAPERQDVILAELEQETAASTGERGRWAAVAVQCLKGRRENHPQAPGVAAALARCADDPFPFTRQATALALTNWEGTPPENALMEQTLVRLLKDDGHGTEEEKALLREEDQVAPAAPDPRVQGLEIRYQAAIALARRGSDRVPLRLLAEMLDEAQLLQTFRRQENGQEVSDAATAYTTVDNTLRAIVELHRQKPGLDLSAVEPAIRRLTQSANVAVRAAAEKALIQVGKL